MEFIQFHPTALFHPPAPRFLISETVRGEGGILVNKYGEHFMPKYHELADLAPRDVVARSILKEMERTGSDRVYLDLSALTADQIRHRFPNIYDTCLHYGLDITAEPIPVSPAAHYMMGGILTDIWGRTSIPGLFACGETADTGVHGANRLASNSLLEGLVFGHRIYHYLQKNFPEIEEFQPDSPPELPQETSRRLPVPSAVYSGTHVCPDGNRQKRTRVDRALETLQARGRPGNPCLDPAYIELQNIRTVARLMINPPCYGRRPGSHYRKTIPGQIRLGEEDCHYGKRITYLPITPENG